MPVYSSYDPEFHERDHAEYGERLFTMSHRRRDGIILTSLGAVSVAVAVVLYWLSWRQEIFVLFAALAGFISLLLLVLGVGTWIRSRTVVHVYEKGIEKDKGGNRSGMLYDDVTYCKLNYISQGATTGIGLVVSDGKTKIKLVDNMGRWDNDSKTKYTSMVNRVTSRIPDSVKVKGDHGRSKD